MSIHYQVAGSVVTITIDRPGVCNAIDRPAAEALAGAMRRFDADPGLSVAVLTGAGGKFCGGADLKAMNDGLRPLGTIAARRARPGVHARDGHRAHRGDFRGNPAVRGR